MRNQVQLIAYVDRLSGGGFRVLHDLLEGPFRGLFGGVHLLPFYWPIDGADAGFDPIDHTQPDSRFGSWKDVRALAEGRDLTADLIVNHISIRSAQFEDFRKNGDRSAYRDLFLTGGRVFPHGASEDDLRQIYRPRPGLPFTKMRLDDGAERLLWTTFTPEQIDIDVRSPAGRAYLEKILREFQSAGIRAIRLDAAGYAIKKPGTSCFMIPETFDFIKALSAQAHELGMQVLVEIHSASPVRSKSRHGGLGLRFRAAAAGAARARATRNVSRLQAMVDDPSTQCAYRARYPRRYRRDRRRRGRGAVAGGSPGLVTPEEIDGLVEPIHALRNGESRQATGAAAINLDLYQVNCAFYDALGGCDRRVPHCPRDYSSSSPGIPQVYYVGLLAGCKRLELLRAHRSVGRDINRRYYSRQEIDADSPSRGAGAVRLIRFRNCHPAFEGEFRLLPGPDRTIQIEWRKGGAWARLEVDLETTSDADPPLR